MSGKQIKKNYSIKFYPDFKDQIDAVAANEGISATALIEREVGRYLRLCKKAALEIKRKREIEKRINEEKEKRGEENE
jgi:hypothetical protein